MAIINKNLIVPYTAAQMYALVNSIEDYPQFLPWCRSAAIHQRSNSNGVENLIATLLLAKGPMQQTITTHNTMVPDSSIAMQYIDGPFKSCSGAWQFTPNDTGCHIHFVMEYLFNNKLLAFTLEPIFAPIANTLAEAFVQRAASLYG